MPIIPTQTWPVDRGGGAEGLCGGEIVGYETLLIGSGHIKRGELEASSASGLLEDSSKVAMGGGVTSLLDERGGRGGAVVKDAWGAGILGTGAACVADDPANVAMGGGATGRLDCARMGRGGAWVGGA